MVPLRRAALFVPAFILACAGDPATPGTTYSFAGQWVIVDSTHYRYVLAFDGTTRVRAWVNALTITAVATSDTSWSFDTDSGSQVRYDTISGVGQPPQSSSLGGFYGTIRLRGDTAYVLYLGKLAIGGASDDVIAFQRTYPRAECLDELGGLAQPSPAPVCREVHRWTRAP